MTLAPVSLARAGGDPDGFSQALGDSFERTGFAVVSDHGIDPAIIARADAAARAFFALPEGTKRRYHVAGTGGARGYTPFGIETAKDAHAHDLKEFWHVGRELPEGHRYAAFMQPNLWPQEVPDFRPALLALFVAFEATGAQLLAGIARYLGLASDFFADPVHDGNSVLRLLHYPPLNGEGASIRAGAHEDINAITLLLGAEEAGLELLRPDGSWLPVSPKPGELVVNIGDMLDRLTGGRLRSTTHRVTNPSSDRRGAPRYSMPFFLHFRPDYMIVPMQGDAAPISAHDFLQQRLREIRLI